jgi:hypothetical protein
MYERMSESSLAPQLHNQHWTHSPSPNIIAVLPNDWPSERVANVSTSIPQSANNQSEGSGTNESAQSPISEANIRLVNRASPTPSSVSIKKYLATPAWDEVHSTVTAHAAMKKALLDMSGLPDFAMWPERPSSSIVGSDSSMNSAASNTSWVSHRSIDPRGSRRGRKVWAPPNPFRAIISPLPPVLPLSPVDASETRSEKGPEKDDQDEPVDAASPWVLFHHWAMPVPKPLISRSLMRPPQSSEADVVATPALEDHHETGTRQKRLRKSAAPAKQPYFCTWLDCKETFRHRFEWARHEEAKHYCPAHWVCCLNDHNTSSAALSSCFLCDEGAITLKHVMDHAQFQSCSNKDAASRSFLRKDHLTQHIKGTHLAPHERAQLTPSILKELLSAWKIDNPVMSKAALFCGFCGITMRSWADRQGHVAGHFLPHSLGSPVCKSSWQLDRVPDVRS